MSRTEVENGGSRGALGQRHHRLGRALHRTGFALCSSRSDVRTLSPARFVSPFRGRAEGRSCR
eukprot:3831450-Rhodomonas_salina.1